MQELNDASNQLARGNVADTRGVNAEVMKYSTRRLKTTPTTTVHQKPSSLATRLVTHDDQSYIQVRGPGITIELPIHVFDPHHVQTPLQAPVC